MNLDKKIYNINMIAEIDENDNLIIKEITTSRIEESKVEEGWEILKISPSQLKYNTLTLGAKFSKRFNLETSKDVKIMVNEHLYDKTVRTHNKMLGRIDGLSAFYDALLEYNDMDITDSSKYEWLCKYSKEDNTVRIIRSDILKRFKTIDKLKELSQYITNKSNKNLKEFNSETVTDFINNSGLEITANDDDVSGISISTDISCIPILDINNLEPTEFLKNSLIFPDELRTIMKYFSIDISEIL